MGVTAQISITRIGNGYIVADASADPYGGSEWRFAEAVHYPTLDALAEDMPRFVSAAVETAAERDRELQEQWAQEEAAMAADPTPGLQRARGAVLGQRMAAERRQANRIG